MKQLLIFLLAFTLFVFLLSVNDFFTTRRTDLAAGPTLSPTLILETPPSSGQSTTPVSFTWRLDSATPRLTNFTTIYWDSISTPSALTTTDHPLAPGYRNYLLDFTSGEFSLPSRFSAFHSFAPGIYYYRAYAFVEGAHLWTPEYQIKVD